MMYDIINVGDDMKTSNQIEWLFLDQTKRDIAVIFPGGGYERTSLREAHPIAHRVMEKGMHAAIIWYRNTKLLYPAILDEGLRFLKEIKEHPWVRKVILIGFSAGGHYALMLAIHGYSFVDRLVLAYPVVSSHPKIRHTSSFINLLGDLSSPYLDEVSLENQIHPHVPEMFILHTEDDQVVPVENSLFLADALEHQGVRYQLQIYPQGRHGFSLGTKEVSFEDMDPEEFEKENFALSTWFDDAIIFMNRGVL